MRGGSQPPWASGPGELLRHGLDLLAEDSDTHRRIAMISIDNAVELMLKTYIGLPKRVTGLRISRKEFEEIKESFPSLLDAIEQHAADKIKGCDLGEIEWYHRLRNQLYHQGNGLTVERDKVEVYAQLANTLFKSLFGVELVPNREPTVRMLGEFMDSWALLEAGLNDIAHNNSLLGRPRTRAVDAARSLRGSGIIEDEEMREIEALRRIRNTVVHGREGYRDVLTPTVVARLKTLAKRFGSAD